MCGYCVKAKSLLNNKGIEFEEKNIAEGHDIQEMLKLVPNARNMPQIFIDDKSSFIGEYTKAIELKRYAKGVYILQIVTADRILNERIIVQ